MTSEQRIAKFSKRAALITDQKHLDRIIESFAPEDRIIAIGKVRGILPPKLKIKDNAETT